MSQQEIDKANKSQILHFQRIQQKGTLKAFGEEVLWKNQHMNLFDANHMVDKIYQIKLQNDFRPGNFMINYRLKSKLTIESLLDLTFEEYETLIDYSIEDYIDRKLSV